MDAGCRSAAFQPSTRATASRIEHAITHTLEMSEWYVNGPLGLQQGFDIRSLPPATAHIGVRVDVANGWRAVKQGDDDIALTDAAGTQTLHYGVLRAWDATGRFLPARLDATDHAIRIQVDTQSAVLPITIDPLLQHTKLPGPGGTRFGTGWSVAVQGHVALVGAPFATVGSNVEQGAVYEFMRNSTTGAWTLARTITDVDGHAQDWFGYSVALDTDSLGVIGVPRADVNGLPDAGRAFAVYINDSGNWSLSEFGSNRASNDLFGWRVAIDRRIIAVSAEQDTVTFLGQGSVEVYAEDDNEFVLQDVLTAIDAAATDHFGYGLAISGNTIVVGANDDDGSFTDQGGVYVFTSPGTRPPGPNRRS